MSHSHKTSVADPDVADPENSVILQQRIAELEARLAQREQELAEATRRASAPSHANNALYHALAANLPNGAAFVVDHDLRYLLAAGEALHAAGMTSADFEGKLLEDALPPDLAQHYIPHFRQALAGIPFRWEHVSHGIHYVSHGTPLCNEQGDIYAILVISYDITKHKQEDEALRLTQERLELALEAAQMGIWQLDLATDTSQRNLRHDQIFGYSELLPAWGLASTRERVLPEDYAVFDEAVARSLESGIYQQEVRIRWPDGSIHWMHDFGRTIESDEAGRPLCIAGITMDITERKQAEESLRQSQDQYRTLFESIDDGFCIIEMLFDENDTPRDYRFLEMNPTFERQTGLEQAKGRTARELVPNLEAHWFEIYGKVALTGESIRFENNSIPMGRWFDVYAFRFGPPANRQVALLFKDVSERKRAEEALHKSEEKYRTLFNSIDEGFCIIEKVEGDESEPLDFLYIEANPAFAAQSGLSNVVGKTIRQVISIEADEWINTYDTILRSGESMMFERKLVAQGRVLEIYAFRVEDEMQRRVGVIFIDITKRKQAEEALRASEQSLRALSQSLEERVEERTQQVRNLITQLTLSEQEERRRISQLLHDDLQQRLYGILFQLNALGHAFADTHRASALNTLAEIEQELNVAVQITRNLSVDLSPPVLHNEGLVEAVAWLATQMERQHGLTVAVQAEDDLPRLHEDLRVLLFQVVRELLFNTVKHAGVATAAVALTHTHDYIRIEVSDQGQGFEVGNGMDKAKDSQGLARIQRRLQLISGHVEVRSAPGAGTQVILMIPANRQTGEPDIPGIDDLDIGKLNIDELDI